MRYIHSWILSGYVRICVVLCKFAGKHLSVSVFGSQGSGRDALYYFVDRKCVCGLLLYFV